MSISSQKLGKIVQLCNSWTNKSKVHKAELQSLLGSLLYITKCVKPARYFLNLMLQLLRDNTHEDIIVLNLEFFKYVAWFNTFLKSYNGVLSRWKATSDNVNKLNQLVECPLWIKTHTDLTLFNHAI